MNYTIGIFFIRKDNKLLICHPTGHPLDVWTIPKGMPDEDDKDYFATAIRELYEETNISYNEIKKDVANILRLGDEIPYKSGKKILIAYYLKYDGDLEFNLKCNSFVHNEFPEVDKFKWVELSEASNLIHESQRKAIPFVIKWTKW